VGHALHCRCVAAGEGGRFADPRDLVGGVDATPGRHFGAARDLLGRGPLLGDRGRDGGADLADSWIVRWMAPIAWTERTVTCCMPAICVVISSVALAV